ncbi:MAG: four helix bundle protein [Candidatus Sumerlaeaceae bacterium]
MLLFGHEKLDVYRLSLQYVAWVFQYVNDLTPKYKNVKDQLLRASQSIPLNIAEGNGKAGDADRRRYFEIARGSAVECAAAQDILEVCGALSAEQNFEQKQILNRIAAMLTKLGNRGYRVQEAEAEYDCSPPDEDFERETRTR